MKKHWISTLLSALVISTLLQPDEFDAPSPLSVAEAQKAAHPVIPSVSRGTREEGRPHAHPPSAEPPVPQQAIYTCPMHPEVTSATPGQCPKCGMQLVKKEK